MNLKERGVTVGDLLIIIIIIITGAVVVKTFNQNKKKVLNPIHQELISFDRKFIKNNFSVY